MCPGSCYQSLIAAMISSNVDSIIHYRHSPSEVAELAQAVVPMMDHIRRVSAGYDRGAIKAILGCEFFRAKAAGRARSALLRACKHARATLHEYFPMLQQQELVNAQALEDAVTRYWRNFQRLRDEVVPVH